MYGFSADILNAIGHAEDPQQQMSDAEVITTGLVAMWFFRGNFEAARALLSMPRYVPHMLSRSRLNRRLHRLTDLFLMLFDPLGCTWKQLNTESIYVIDSFPVTVCDNYRIPWAKLYRNKEYRGCIASKKRYFYGLKVHLLVTKDGQPVECVLTPGSYSDVRMLKAFRFDVPEGVMCMRIKPIITMLWKMYCWKHRRFGSILFVKRTPNGPFLRISPMSNMTIAKGLKPSAA
jgi:Transposase DDE domain